MLALVIMTVKTQGFEARIILPEIGYIIMGAYSMFTALAMTSRDKNSKGVKISREATKSVKKSKTKTAKKEKPVKHKKETFTDVEDTAYIPTAEDTDTKIIETVPAPEKAETEKQEEIVDVFRKAFEESAEEEKPVVKKTVKRTETRTEKQSGKTVFRGDGSRKKDTSKKVVWKAPK